MTTLIERLKNAGVDGDTGGSAGYCWKLCASAADEIERQAKEIEALKADAARYEYMIDCDFRAGKKYFGVLNEASYKGKLRAKHDAAIGSAMRDKL